MAIATDRHVILPTVLRRLDEPLAMTANLNLRSYASSTTGGDAEDEGNTHRHLFPLIRLVKISVPPSAVDVFDLYLSRQG